MLSEFTGNFFNSFLSDKNFDKEIVQITLIQMVGLLISDSSVLMSTFSYEYKQITALKIFANKILVLRGLVTLQQMN